MYKNSFKKFLPMLDADDGLTAGGTGVEEPEVAEPDVEEGVEETEAAEPSEEEQPKSDAAFANMRRQLEAANKRIAEMEQTATEYEDALGLFFQGENKAAQAKAYHDDLPLDKVIADMNAAREKKTLEAEITEKQRQIDALLFENQKAKDLKALHDAGYKVNSLDELGEDYFAFRTMGMTPQQVYEGLQMKKGKPPKSMGEVKTATPQRDTFTREEVEAMSSAERVKNYDKIRKSMSTWK